MDVNRPLIDFRVHAPHAVEQLSTGEDAAGALHQELKKLELGRAKVQLAITAPNPVTAAIQK